MDTQPDATAPAPDAGGAGTLSLDSPVGGADMGAAGGQPPKKPVKITSTEPKKDVIRPLQPKDGIIPTFLRMFKIGVNPEKEVRDQQIYPLIQKQNDLGMKRISKDVFPDEVQKLYNYWLEQCHDDRESWKDRQKLWEDLDMLYFNNAIVNRAIEMVADEVIQADTHDQPIMVEGEEKQKQFILDFFDDIGLYGKLRPIASDIVQYGNAGTVVGLDDSGVNDLILIDIKELTERMEFTPYKIKMKIDGGDEFLQRYRGKIKRIDQLIKSIQNTDNIISHYKKYLFGFQVGENVLPPWRFLHFRNVTSKSPFDPYGIPMFIGSIAPYRQFDAAMTMQVIARGARFPRHIYKLTLPNVINPTEKMSTAIDMINQLQNSGLMGIRKEDPGIGEIIITIDGLYVYEQETPQIDVGKIDDIEMLRDDLIISTNLPRYLIDQKDAGFGDSGSSLVEKWKPFARFVYRTQQSILEQITQLVKIHMIQSRRFKEEEIDFVLSMNFPESSTNKDLIDNQKEILELANSVVETLQNTFNGGNVLPDELIKAVYTKFLPYNDSTFKSWFDMLGQAQKKQEEEAEKDATTPAEVEKKAESVQRWIDHEKRIMGRVTGANWNLLEQKMKVPNLKEEMNKVILKVKQKTLREGVIMSKHYYSSKNKTTEFDPFILNKLDKELLNEQFADKGAMKKLMEGDEVATTKYVFSRDGEV